MTVVFQQDEARKFTANEVIWAKRELIDAIVRQALIGQTEGFIEMIIDNEPHNELTRDRINEILRGVKESAGEFLNDVIGDLKYEVERRLAAANYGAAVTGIKYGIAGDVKDIEVDVSVSMDV